MTNARSAPFEIPTSSGHTIRGTLWQPQGEVTAALQLFHGLGEHHSRYDRFARLAAGRGYAVVAHDHRGHGPHADELGFFAANGGWQLLVSDGLQVQEMIVNQYPNIPIVLLGHSMGSYVAQYFAMQHRHRLAAMILSASTWPSKLKILLGQLIARFESWRLGIHGQSALLHKLGFGDFNKRFEPARTEHDWLSRDESEVDTYIADSLCGGPYSCGLWIDILGGLRKISSDDALQEIPAELPLLLTGGADDPVGGDKGISKLATHYTRSGHSHVTVKIYPGGRHEMFNETNKDEFYADLLKWISSRLL